ncbi:hypothetical protein ACOSQ2_016500 [Xanthoceras sorbifolium]
MKHAQKQENAKGVLPRSCSLCSIPIQSISNKKCVGKNTTRSLEWKKPGISHLKVFGSITHTHVPDESKSQLNDKSEKFIFIGYDNFSKGYKLYNPNNGKTIISRDVVFDEKSTRDWKTHDEDYNFLPYLEKENGGAIKNGASRTRTHYTTNITSFNK